MARYKQLLFYAAKLPPMAAEQHKPENKVEGCVSQVSSDAAMVSSPVRTLVVWRSVTGACAAAVVEQQCMPAPTSALTWLPFLLLLWPLT